MNCWCLAGMRRDYQSVVFEVQMGMIDKGAPVQWCSQYPEEAEILFAPLTGWISNSACMSECSNA